MSTARIGLWILLGLGMTVLSFIAWAFYYYRPTFELTST
jgi:hypothetical protein